MTKPDKIEYIDEQDSDSFDKKLKKVKDKLKTCEKERGEYLAGWQRAKADYINLEKRINQEKSEWIKFANSELILRFLPILDSLEEAMRHPPAGGQADKGIQQVYNQLKTILKKEGLEEIKSVGEKFNPELHEVIENTKGRGKEGTIVEEVQRGYKLHGKVIRPSKVKIGK
jgi:molecular chaperone GrpE